MKKISNLMSKRLGARATLFCVFLLAACRPTRTAVENPMQNNEDVKVSWNLSKGTAGLEVKYTVRNTTSGTIYLLDQPVKSQNGKYAMLADRSVVQRGGRPNLVKFSRGWISAASQEPEVEQGEHNPIFPVARELQPGAELQGAFVVPLPIAPWHPNLKMAPIEDPKKAILEVGYLTGEPAWSELPADSGPLRVPARPWAVKEQWAHGEEKSLP